MNKYLTREDITLDDGTQPKGVGTRAGRKVAESVEVRRKSRRLALRVAKSRGSRRVPLQRTRSRLT